MFKKIIFYVISSPLRNIQYIEGIIWAYFAKKYFFEHKITKIEHKMLFFFNWKIDPNYREVMCFFPQTTGWLCVDFKPHGVMC